MDKDDNETSEPSSIKQLIRVVGFLGALIGLSLFAYYSSIGGWLPWPVEVTMCLVVAGWLACIVFYFWSSSKYYRWREKEKKKELAEQMEGLPFIDKMTTVDLENLTWLNWLTVLYAASLFYFWLIIRTMSGDLFFFGVSVAGGFGLHQLSRVFGLMNNNSTRFRDVAEVLIGALLVYGFLSLGYQPLFMTGFVIGMYGLHRAVRSLLVN